MIDNPGIWIAAIIVIVVIASYLLWRRTSHLPSTTDAEPSLLEIARLQEQLKAQATDSGRKDAALKQLSDSLDALQREHAANREKLAAADEKVTGLQETVLHERSTNEVSRRGTLNDLGTAITARDKLQISVTEVSQKLAAAAQMEQELRERVGRAEKYIAERDERITTLQAQIDTLQTTVASRDSDISASSEREAALTRTISERDKQLEGLQERLKSEFENIANKVLSTTASQLTEKSHKSLAAVLDPLKERITEFQNKVEVTHLEDTAQRSALSEQIKQVALTGQSIGLEAHNLTKALKGDSQIRGRWGEVRLERILEKSGLERGREFIVQGGDLDIRSEEGGNQRPDVVILLPEGRHFVIDSKVSLIDYVEYEAAETEDLRAAALKRVLSSVRAHIDGLSGKNYQYADAINSHDLVFMFIPIEGVAALALQNDDRMFDYAWSRKIVMASPSTLFMTMRTVASIWRYERQGENAQTIALLAGKLYDKLAGVVGDLNDVSAKIQAAADVHSDAMRKLSTGRGNALSQAQRLKTLGVASKKELPVILLSGEDHIIESDDDDGLEKSENENVIHQRTSSSEIE